MTYDPTLTTCTATQLWRLVQKVLYRHPNLDKLEGKSAEKFVFRKGRNWKLEVPDRGSLSSQTPSGGLVVSRPDYYSSGPKMTITPSFGENPEKRTIAVILYGVPILI